MRFENQVAISTGAASGMGLLFAQCFAAEGGNVVMCDVNDAVLQEKVDEINIQIADLKTELASTDYKCLKWLEGAMTDEEYAKVKAHRAGLRERINAFENERDN